MTGKLHMISIGTCFFGISLDYVFKPTWLPYTPLSWHIYSLGDTSYSISACCSAAKQKHFLFALEISGRGSISPVTKLSRTGGPHSREEISICSLKCAAASRMPGCLLNALNVLFNGIPALVYSSLAFS